jgi:hypothetical protein
MESLTNNQSLENQRSSFVLGSNTEQSQTGYLSWLCRFSLWGGAALFLSVAGIYAFSITFSQFACYDDQGLLMISVQGFLSGNALYSQVSSLYGPFYFFCEWLVHGVCRIPLTHDVSGIECALYWVSASATLAWGAFKLTRSSILTVFVFMQAIVHLTGLGQEPGHPQQLIVLLLAISAVLVIRDVPSARIQVVLGILCAALVFTKINVGGLYAIALAISFASQTSVLRRFPILYWAVVAISGLIPFLLMRSHLNEDWARNFSVVASLTVVASGVAAYVFAGHSTLRISCAMGTVFGFLAAAASLFVLMLARGTSPSAAVDGMITRPFSVSHLVCHPLSLGKIFWPSVLSAFAAPLAFYYRPKLENVRVVTATLKCAYGLVGSLLLVSDPTAQVVYLFPWAWLLLLPNSGSLDSGFDGRLARTFICLAACWQTLQAFPVAGTQVAVGTFLGIWVYSIALYDGAALLAREARLKMDLESIPPRTSFLFKSLLFMSLFHLFEAKWCTPLYYWNLRSSMPALDLPGTRLVHLPTAERRSLRRLTAFLESECETFLTVPGMNSLYFWAHKGPPSYFTVSEVPMLTESEQAEIISALRRAKRPLIVVNKDNNPFLTDKSVYESALVRFISEQCSEVAHFGAFQVVAPKATLPHPGSGAENSLDLAIEPEP